MKQVFVDMDGVLADFDSHMYDCFGYFPGVVPEDQMWEAVHRLGKFFRTIPPFEGMLGFWRDIDSMVWGVGYNPPIVCTACPKTNYIGVALQKKEWIKEHLPFDVVVLPVMGGRHKGLFMRNEGDILIDDMEKNIKSWEDLGGVGILHSGNYSETLGKLEKAMAYG